MSREVSAQVVINLPLDEAWDKLRDLSLAHNYVPGIVKTEIVSERNEGVGASRYVYRNAKSYIQETVVEWDEGQGFLIRLHKGDKPAPPFRNAWFRYQLDDEGQEKTLFTASLEFEMPWGRLGAWLEKKSEKIVAAIVSDVATAMKLYYETGKPTSAAALKSYKTSLQREQ
jgi:hypothetical protein